jgi:hypothetical protein
MEKSSGEHQTDVHLLDVSATLMPTHGHKIGWSMAVAAPWKGICLRQLFACGAHGLTGFARSFERGQAVVPLAQPIQQRGVDAIDWITAVGLPLASGAPPSRSGSSAAVSNGTFCKSKCTRRFSGGTSHRFERISCLRLSGARLLSRGLIEHC